MAADAERIQWRHNNGYDSLLVLDSIGDVVTWCDAAFRSGVCHPLKDFLTDMGDLSDWSLNQPEEVDPEKYGKLIMERHRSGEVLYLTDNLFRKRLAFHFHP